MRTDALRRALVFAVLFGGAMGLVAWLAGRRERTAPAANDTKPEVLVHPGDVAPVAPNVSVGTSDDGTLTHDAVAVIEGKPHRFRAWTAAWKKSTPRESSDPEVALYDVTALRVVLYPQPQTATSAPVAEGGPGTTRLTSKTGSLEYRRNVRTSAHLTGDVLIERFDPDRGDLRLATQSLDCALDSAGGSERRTAHTPDPVTIDAGRAHIQGTGLDADLAETTCRVTLLADVKGRFDAAPGSLTVTGPAPGTEPRPTVVTCSGPCELVSLDTKAKPADRRWKATFRDDVHVVQGEDSLDCDLLEVEFKLGETKAAKGQLPPEHVVATGHVHARGRTEARRFEVVCAKATRSRSGTVGNETDVVVFEGSPVMDVRGRFGTARAPGQPAPKDETTAGRLEIRCDGTATMTTRKAGKQASQPNRTNVVFEKNVVARQWDDEKAADATGELRAQIVTLFGTRLDGGQFVPDTLTAEGPGGVDIKRPDFTSHSAVATWMGDGAMGIDHYLLSGRPGNGPPKVVCSGVAPLGFGKAEKAKADSVVVLESDDNVTVNLFRERSPNPNAPPRPYATLSAGPRVVMTQSVAGKDVALLTADQLDATMAPGRRLEQVRAQGGAHAWGVGPDGSQREVYGTRILLDELVAPEGQPHPARITALGEESAPAVAIVHETDGHAADIRAETLRYDQEGALVTASGHVVINASVPAKEQKPGTPAAAAPKLTDGAVKITAAEARAELGAAAGDKQELRKVTATGGVLIDGKVNRITGDDVVYDAVTGVAEVTGSPARVVNLGESERYTSFVNADLIRAYFDVASNDPSRKGQLLRATCPKGGLIVRYIDPPGPDGRPVPGTTARRLQVRSDGPMEITRAEATAVDNVRADMWSLAPSGDWTIQDATLYCERAHLTFEGDTPGAVKDRLRTADLTGSPTRQVIVETPEMRARADRVDINCAASTMRLSTSSERSVYVHRLVEGSQALCDGVTFNYKTHEWTDLDRPRDTEEQPPVRTEAK
jgi:lipopolysaccharide export system protein LptA